VDAALGGMVRDDARHRRRPRDRRRPRPRALRRADDVTVSLDDGDQLAEAAAGVDVARVVFTP
jgi:hypothetical protein